MCGYDAGNVQRLLMVGWMADLWGDWESSSAFVTIWVRSIKLQWYLCLKYVDPASRVGRKG